MKYFSSDMYEYIRVGGKGHQIPLTWKDIDDDEESVIHDHMDERYHVYDADTCGSSIVYFAFDNGKIYAAEHSWWLSYDEEIWKNDIVSWEIDSWPETCCPLPTQDFSREWLLIDRYSFKWIGV